MLISSRLPAEVRVDRFDTWTRSSCCRITHPMSNFSYSNSNLSNRRIGNWMLLEKLGSGFSGEWVLFNFAASEIRGRCWVWSYISGWTHYS